MNADKRRKKDNRYKDKDSLLNYMAMFWVGIVFFEEDVAKICT